MPLRDHFKSTVDDRDWGPVHGAWPTVMAMHLNRILPDRFVARPQVDIGVMEIDLAGFERTDTNSLEPGKSGEGLQWSLSEPALLLEEEDTVTDDFEVRIYDHDHSMKLVCALELVSPSNKDRPESRQKFVTKCESHLRSGVSIAIVDIVTSRHANLYDELQDAFEARKTPVAESLLYAVSCRGHRTGNRRRWEAWEYDLAIGKKLPTIPLWLSETYRVPLDLEETYEETCRSLRIR